MSDFKSLHRRKIRYWCFRLYTESIGGEKANNCPEGLREHFENHMWFPGWKKFGISWDISEKDNLEIVPLKQSLESSWNNEAVKLAKDLPIK